MWDRVRQAAHEIGREEVEQKRAPHEITPGQEMIKDMLARRRIIAKQQHVARGLRRCFSKRCMDGIIECTTMSVACTTCAVFLVCLVMVAHLDNNEVLLPNRIFRIVTIAAFASWIGSFCLLALFLWFSKCLQMLETDPDEDPDECA